MITGSVDAVIGVDTHRDTHTAALTDPVGRQLDMLVVPADAAGYDELLAWAAQTAPGPRLLWLSRAPAATAPAWGARYAPSTPESARSTAPRVEPGEQAKATRSTPCSLPVLRWQLTRCASRASMVPAKPHDCCSLSGIGWSVTARRC